MALYGGLAENTRRNERYDRGTVTVPTTGSVVVTVAAPMRVLTSVDAIQQTSTSPGVGPSTLTVAMGPAANQFTIYSWQPSASSNATLVAGSSSSITVQWQAFGTLDLSNTSAGIP